MADDCILWTGGKFWDGYGYLVVKRKRVRAHRHAFQQAYGYLPKMVLHKCDVRACVNPAHLEAGDQMKNVADCIARGRARYVRGRQVRHVKMQEQTAIRIKMLRGVVPCPEVARWLGLEKSTVDKCSSGRTWKHVTAATRYGPVGRA